MEFHIRTSGFSLGKDSFFAPTFDREISLQLQEGLIYDPFLFLLSFTSFLRFSIFQVPQGWYHFTIQFLLRRTFFSNPGNKKCQNELYTRVNIFIIIISLPPSLKLRVSTELILPASFSKLPCYSLIDVWQQEGIVRTIGCGQVTQRNKKSKRNRTPFPCHKLDDESGNAAKLPRNFRETLEKHFITHGII